MAITMNRLIQESKTEAGVVRICAGRVHRDLNNLFLNSLKHFLIK